MIATDTHLEQNLAAMRHRAPGLADAVEAAPPIPGVELFESASGHVNARVPGPNGELLPLHCPHDPVKQAARNFDSVPVEEVHGRLMLGFGLGYHVEAFLAVSSPHNAVVIIEPDVRVLRLACELRDLRALFEDVRVKWIFGRRDQREIYRLLIGMESLLLPLKLRVFAAAELLALEPDFYYGAAQAAADFVKSGYISLTGRFELTEKVWRNQMCNLPRYVSRPTLAELRPFCVGRPGVVVAAGPSLHKNLEVLKQTRNRAVVVVCDITLKPLLAAGVTPDFAAMVDFQQQTEKFFETLPAGTTTRLIAIGGAWPGSLEKYPGPLCFTGDKGLDALLLEMKRPMGGYQSAAHVGGFAFDIARFLGLDPIALVGLDLAFPGHITHLPGTPTHEEWQCERGRFFTVEMREYEHFIRRRQRLVEVKDVNGNDVWTERSMQHYLRELESAIQVTPARVVDCTEGGAAKAGVEVMTLADFLVTCPERGPLAMEVAECDAERLAAAAKLLDRRIMDLHEIKEYLSRRHKLGRKLEKQYDYDEVREPEFRKLSPEAKSLVLKLKKLTEDQARWPHTFAVLLTLAARPTWEQQRNMKSLLALKAAGKRVYQASNASDQQWLESMQKIVKTLDRQIRVARKSCRTGTADER